MDVQIWTVPVIFMLLITGCSSPTISATSTTTGTPSQSTHSPTLTSSTTTPPSQSPAGPITVVGGPIPVDVNQVWYRVQDLIGTNVTPPRRVIVVTSNDSDLVALRPDRFYTTMTGVRYHSFTPAEVRGHVRNPDTVHIRWSPNTTSPARLEQVLVHEFTHVVQFRQRVMAGSDIPLTVRGGLLQGGAIFVAEAYTNRYLEGVRRPSERTLSAYETAGSVERYFLRQNYYGYRYLAARIDTPRQLSAVYRHPPQTTEQFIHNLTPDQEPPVSLSATVNRSVPGEWVPVGNRTAGELFVQLVLATQLTTPTATSAARGWGNDRLITFWNGTAYSFVWVLRWDDAANASEFRSTLGQYLDRRATPMADGWRTNGTAFRTWTVDDETVVLIVGPDEFVRNASIHVAS